MTGVCAGLARKLDKDPWLVRIIWLLAGFIVAGIPLLGYIVAIFVIPEED